MKTLKVNVVMLPTESKSAPLLSKIDDEEVIYFPHEIWPDGWLTKRHLYFTSTRVLELNRWVLNSSIPSRGIMKTTHFGKGSDIGFVFGVRTTGEVVCMNMKDTHIIEATSDENLKIDLIAKGFIGKYAKLYNTPSRITEVRLKLSKMYSDLNFYILEKRADNTVITLKVYDSYPAAFVNTLQAYLPEYIPIEELYEAWEEKQKEGV